MTPTSLVAYLVLFATVGFLLIFVALLVGRLLRPRVPTPEKLEIYECGEPTIGSGFVQFDLRFYVVALVFIIFEVEVAFFFPWAVVFGKANRLRSQSNVEAIMSGPSGGPDSAVELTPAATQTLTGLGVRHPTLPFPSGGVEANAKAVGQAADRLALTAMIDMGVFFVVLLVGFAYVWSRGDLDWVRALSRPQVVGTEAVATGDSYPPTR
jgi:NADH-quinone oxidoreductase subunit A